MLSCTIFEILSLIFQKLKRLRDSDPELQADPNFKIRPDPAHENRDPTRPDD